jgi:hypothetical protein
MTNERLTPETDAETMQDEMDHVDSDIGPFAPSNTVCADFARKLERERDEAREDAERWESSSDAMERAGAEQARRADENREWALRAEQERDEAREFCFQMVDLIAYGLGQNGSFWSQKAMSEAREAISKAKALEAAK